MFGEFHWGQTSSFLVYFYLFPTTPTFPFSKEPEATFIFQQCDTAISYKDAFKNTACNLFLISSELGGREGVCTVRKGNLEFTFSRTLITEVSAWICWDRRAETKHQPGNKVVDWQGRWEKQVNQKMGRKQVRIWKLSGRREGVGGAHEWEREMSEVWVWPWLALVQVGALIIVFFLSR